MSKRAANTLWHRADQVEMVKTNITRILYHDNLDAHEVQAAITHELAQLQNVIEAMQQDSRDERRRGQEWFSAEMERDKVRREQERKEVRRIMREQREAMEDQKEALEEHRIHPVGPKVEEAL